MEWRDLSGASRSGTTNHGAAGVDSERVGTWMHYRAADAPEDCGGVLTVR